MLNNTIIPSANGGPLADGGNAPTTNWYNPMWARYFDILAGQNGGQMPVFQGRGSSLQKQPTSPTSLQQLTSPPAWSLG